MEDVATAEISRSQLWQWRVNKTSSPRAAWSTCALLFRLQGDELERLGGKQAGRLKDAAELLTDLVMSDDFADFLTLEAYQQPRLTRAGLNNDRN